jgi:hypothetical protein
MTMQHEQFYCLPLLDPGIARAFTYCHVAIAISYLVISLYIQVFARARGMSFLPRRWLDNAFAVFIVGCGATHAVAAYTMWNGSREKALGELAVLGITAVASLLTAVAVVAYRRELGRPPADEVLKKLRWAEAGEKALGETLALYISPAIAETARAHFDLRRRMHEKGTP